MMTATPPAYHQNVDIDDQSRVSSGYSDDAKEAELLLLRSIEHFRSTPARTFAASFYDDYKTPPPQSRRRMKVKFSLRGAGAPLALDADENNE